MKYFVGIDVSKYFHVACVVDEFGEVHIDPFKFDNNLDGFNMLISKIKKILNEDITFGFESTGHYHQNLFNFLTSKKLSCVLLNPLLTKRFRSISIRDVKNDKIDSITIATFLIRSNIECSDFLINDLKELCQERENLKHAITTEKIKLTAYLDKVFPELKSFVKNSLYSKGFLNFLKQYNTAEIIKITRLDKLHNCLNENRDWFDKSKTEKIKSLAKNSVGFHSSAISKIITNIVCQIELLEEQFKNITTEIKTIIINSNTALLKIPGMGKIEAAYILSAIDNIARFDSPSKIVAFAGLDPKIRQSGQFNARSTRMSKRGNKLLRYALIWSAYNTVRHSQTMNDYYLLKRSQGKSHYNALGHCSRKLCNYIFYVLSNPNKEFVLE